jgi:hypothetical protein
MDITLLLGAGASADFDIPVMKQITEEFYREFPDFNEYLDNMIGDLSKTGFPLHVENYLSYARGQLNPINTILKCSPFISYFVSKIDDENRGYNKNAGNIIYKIEEYISYRYNLNAIYVESAIERYGLLFNILKNKYSEGVDDWDVDIFTTNYDNVIEYYATETGVDTCIGYNIASDYTMTYNPRLFNARKCIKLHKLHGSVTYGLSQNIENGNIMTVYSLDGFNIGDEYPAGHKVIERVMINGWEKDPSIEPFFDHLNHLKNSLSVKNNVLVIGFSFQDPPILNVFKDVLKTKGAEFKVYIMGKSSEVIKEELFNDDDRIIPIKKRFKKCNELMEDLK